MEIKTIDLIEITNAARAFKQRDVMLYHGQLYGLDNSAVYITYTSVLNLSQPYPPLIFNYRKLSAFMKNVTTEEVFVADEHSFIHTEFKAMDDKMVDTIYLGSDPIQLQIVEKNHQQAMNILSYSNKFVLQEPLDVTDELQNLFALRKTDGTIQYIKRYNNQNYFMILFAGLLPLNKSDRIYMNIYDNSSNTFISNFMVRKKNLQVYALILHLKI